MAYSVSLVPNVVAQGVGGGPKIYLYASDDIHTTVAGAGYFTNGDALGMEVNDVVIVVKTSATIGATMHVVTTVVGGGAATISAAILA